MVSARRTAMSYWSTSATATSTAPSNNMCTSITTVVVTKNYDSPLLICKG